MVQELANSSDVPYIYRGILWIALSCWWPGNTVGQAHYALSLQKKMHSSFLLVVLPVTVIYRLLWIFLWPNSPWDFNVTDSEEEIHLIFHMWIGLFYSKSAPRFFHLDSDYFPPEEREGGAQSPRDVHLQLSSITDFPPKASVTSTPKYTTPTSTLVKAPLPQMEPFTPVTSQLPSDESLMKASASPPEVWPESPSSYQVLDLSLKSCKALDLTSSTPNTSRVDSAHSDPGVEQLKEELDEGPLDLRIEPVCARTQPQMKVSTG